MGGLIFLILGTLALFIVSRVFRHNAKVDPSSDVPFAGLAKTFGVLTLAVPVIALTFMSARTVDPGHVGVQTLFGKVQQETLAEGLHFINPLTSVHQMSVQMQKDDGQYEAATQDMQTVRVKMSMNFRLDTAQAREVFQKIGVEYVSKVVEPAAQEVLKAETAKHKANEILTKRSEIKAKVQETIGAWLTKYGIELKEISISNVQFDPEYARAIEQKQIQEQLAEQKEYEVTKAQREAEIAAATAKGVADANRESAKGSADAAREAARGKADALKIEAEAQADYNRKVAESLTPTLIQSDYIRRWDGKLPQFVTGGSGTFLQLPVPVGK